MTRDTACSPGEHLPRDRARRDTAPPAAPSPRAPPPGRRCRPTCRRSSSPVRRCSAPSSSRITVPDAALLPSTPRPVRRENSASSSAGKAAADRSRTASAAPARTAPSGRSCCPSPDSPAPRCRAPPSAPAPAPRRGSAHSDPARVARGSGSVSPPTARATLPRVSLPASPYAAVSGAGPHPRPSSTMMAARRAPLTDRPRCSGARPAARAT